MKTTMTGRAVLLIVIIAASTLGLLVYLPFAKEGFSWSDWPILAGAIVSAVVLAILWWLAVDASLRHAFIGWIILFPPLAAYALSAVLLVHERAEAVRFMTQMSITGYHEEPIIWPGFDGPVGYRISFDLNHPPGLNRLVNPPEIRMGPELDIPYDKLAATYTGGSGYFKDDYVSPKTGKLAILKTVMFQRMFDNPSTSTDYMKWSAMVRTDPQGKTQLTYHLLPGTIELLLSPNHICLRLQTEKGSMCGPQSINPQARCKRIEFDRLNYPVLSAGTNLTALWLVPPTIDISRALTSTLRKQSNLQNNTSDWLAMHERMTPAGLAGAGYALCEPGKGNPGSFRLCFCRAAG